MNSSTLILQKHRAIHIPLYDPPYILEDSITDMKRYIFYSDQTYFRSFDNDHAFMLSASCSSDHLKINFFATTLVRSLYPTISNAHFAIYGPALIVGMDEDTNYTSVSYHFLDATINLMSRFKYEV